ncbi:MAG: fructose-bisphosphatase class II, partial [Rhodobacteraceae bacterium]|nr:fructose-bisphosphatase class II [Paracoccaceae bacterium]
KDIVSLDSSPSEIIKTLARYKGCKPEDISSCVLDRPRHKELIGELRDLGVAVRLITDGDVAAIMHCSEPEVTGIDVYMGIGGAPEGVLAAAALKCLGGQIFGRLLFRNDVEKAKARKMNITNLDKIYTLDELVQADIIFSATGVTDGSLLRGLKKLPGYLETDTILLRSKTGSRRRMVYSHPIQVEK